jgi:hypothetical protein
MIQQRQEQRKYRVKRRDTERDATGRANQKTIWFDCPFCGTEIKARVWSLCGNGKRCECGALFYSGGEACKLVATDEALNAGVNFAIRETQGSKPGRAEAEVFAPDGYSFDGERHSMIAHGRTLAEAKEIALADARSTQLIACKQDCNCNEID